MKISLCSFLLLLLPVVATAGGGSDPATSFTPSPAAGVEKPAPLPLKKNSDEEQKQVCDEEGRIRRIDRPDGSFAEYFYHPTLNKVRLVVSNTGSRVFTYNKAGDLIRVYNSKGPLIELSYDRRKQIRRIVVTDGITKTQRKLTLKYNALGKPVTIRMIGKGEINVVYNGQGEILKVASKQGSIMALAVTEFFQTVQRGVKGAGVDFGMGTGGTDGEESETYDREGEAFDHN